MRKIFCILVCIFILFSLSFPSYASEHLIPPEKKEYQEILSMKDDVLFHINYGGARTELNRDVEADEVKMERAYKVYANSELLKTKDIKKSLANSHYNWQIPVYTDGFTILADISKTASIPDDIPEDAKEMLKDDLNHWTVGAVYVYETETIAYDSTVAASLGEAGYNSNEYTYEVVSGLPGIRYPAAIIFNADENPEFVIPVEEAAARAFHGDWPTAAKNVEKTDKPSDGQNNDTIKGFSVYYYDDVARASNSCNQSEIGLSYQKSAFDKRVITVLMFGAAGSLLMLLRRKSTKR